MVGTAKVQVTASASTVAITSPGSKPSPIRTQAPRNSDASVKSPAACGSGVVTSTLSSRPMPDSRRWAHRFCTTPLWEWTMPLGAPVVPPVK